MLVGGIVAVVVAAGVVVGVLVHWRAQDDVHSVEHYHRKLHTLEEIRAHPSASAAGAAGAVGAANGNGSASGDEHANGANGSGTSAPDDAAEGEGAAASPAGASYPASAVRLAGSPAVRLTDADHSPPPPAPPPPVSGLAKPVRFGDDGQSPIPATFMSGNDRAMDSISHAPRRLGGPLAAVAVVTVLVIILIVTGLHSTPSPTSSHSHSHAHSSSGAQAGSHAGSGSSGHRSVTSTTVAPRHPSTTNTTVVPVVSAPSSTSPNKATYTVGSANYALVLSATSGPSWVQATDASTGAVLFIGTLDAGQSHTVTATGPVAVVTGAPSAFAATVNGTPVTLPAGYQAPFTLSFQTPQEPGSGSSSGSG